MDNLETLEKESLLEFATLTIGEDLYCISIDCIRETRRWTRTSMLPNSPDYIMGALNLRGVIIPILDLSAVLGMKHVTPTHRHIIFIIEHENQTVGLVVDSAREIICISTDLIHEPPQAAQLQNNFISGLLSHGEDMIRVIDIDGIIKSFRGSTN